MENNFEHQFNVRHYTWVFKYIQPVKMIHLASYVANMVYKFLEVQW